MRLLFSRKRTCKENVKKKNVLNAFSLTLKRKASGYYHKSLFANKPSRSGCQKLCFIHVSGNLIFTTSTSSPIFFSVQTGLHWITVVGHLTDGAWCTIIEGEEVNPTSQVAKFTI